MFLTLTVPVGVEELVDGAYEVLGRRRCRDSTRENRLIGNIVTIVVAGVVLVLVDDVAGEVDAGKDAFAAGVGENLCIGQFSGGGLRIAAYGAGGYGCVATELELVVEEVLEAIMIHRDQDEVCRLTADLEAEAGPGQLDEGGCAPAVAGAAGDDALAVLSAEHEGSLFVAGDDGDAGGSASDVVRNATIRSVHEFVENQVRGFDAVIEFLHVSGGCGHSQGCSDAKCLN
jgi:hypothetical protein